MSELLAQTPWLAPALAALAVALVVALLVSSAMRVRVPLERRRPNARPAESVMAPLAAALTSAVGRLMRSRGTALQSLVDIAGVKQRPQDLLTVTLIASAVILVAGLLAHPPLMLLAAAPPALLLGGLHVLVSRRRAAFAAQMDEIMQIIASSLRAGQSLPQALAGVARDADAPASEELQRVVAQNRLGRPLDEALDETTERMRNKDFLWAAQAIQINREVGGSLADVLDGVASTVRERGQLRRLVASLAAEGKLSAYVLIALPIGILLFLMTTNPGYLVPLLTTPIGWFMCAAAAVMMLAGSFWIIRIVRIDL